IKAINKQYGTSLNVTKVYDYPTTRDFAVYLAHELSAQAGEKISESDAPNQTEMYAPMKQKTAAPAAKPDNISLQPLEHHQPLQEEASATIQYAAAEI
ncbi:hypothetical protein C1X64_35485, partial [Pseudomonas sp. GW456-E7]